MEASFCSLLNADAINIHYISGSEFPMGGESLFENQKGFTSENNSYVLAQKLGGTRAYSTQIQIRSIIVTNPSQSNVIVGKSFV